MFIVNVIFYFSVERRQAQLSQQTENQEPPLSGTTTTSLHTVKTPSQRTLASAKAGSTSGDTNMQQLEARS